MEALMALIIILIVILDVLLIIFVTQGARILVGDKNSMWVVPILIAFILFILPSIIGSIIKLN